jgi:acetyltransferase
LHPLHRLFSPRAVALVGASESPSKYGHLLLRTLREEGYPGRILPVNPQGGALPGLPFLRSLDEAPGEIDVALVVRPAPECPGIVEDLAARKVPFVIVYAAGFAESGEAGRRLQDRMVASAREGGTRIVGPNGMNIVSVPDRLNLSAIVPFPAGSLGFLSASGNLGYAFAHEAPRHGVGFSRFVSAGNQADLALDEYLDYLGADEATSVVLVYLEGFKAGRERAFLEAVSRAAARKPVLVLRGGRTRAGSGTARSHTGALAVEGEVSRQALEQAGAVLLDRADETLAVARAFLTSPLPRGRRVLLAGEGGGHATLATDAASEAGLEVASIPEDLVNSFAPGLPPFAAILRNPVEFGGMSEYDLQVYERVLGPLLRWEGSEMALLFGGYALYDAPLVAFLAAQKAERPVLLHDLYADEDRPALKRLRDAGLPVYASVEVMARCAAALYRGATARVRAARALEPAPPRATPALPAGLRRALGEARGRSDRALLEEDASALLTLFGLPLPPSALARSAEEAVEKARGLGFPVVLKVHAAGIVHKTDRGGVHLDLRSPEDVRSAYEKVRALVSGPSPEVRLTPYLPGGLEALLGARRDPSFGPVALLGAGGIFAEALGGAAIRTLPCPRAELLGMVDESPLARLSGRRGGPRIRPETLVPAIEGLGGALLSCPEIEDIEINPLRVTGEGCLALDARVIVAP